MTRPTSPDAGADLLPARAARLGELPLGVGGKYAARAGARSSGRQAERIRQALEPYGVKVDLSGREDADDPGERYVAAGE